MHKLNNTILFIGDSHTKGYRLGERYEQHWSENNYAEIYGKMHDIPVVIYAQESAGNYAYVEWLKKSIEMHKEIGCVFIQSTYWNRYNICASSRIDHGIEYKLGHFCEEDKSSNQSCKKYTDLSIKDDFIELKMQPDPLSYDAFTGFKIDFAEAQDLREIQHYDFDFTNLFYVLMSQLQYKQFTKDLVVIDNICKEHNIPWYLWRMNLRVTLPQKCDPWCKFTNGKIIKTPAENWFFTNKDIVFENHKVDDEHYDSYIHEQIANHFIPGILNNQIA